MVNMNRKHVKVYLVTFNKFTNYCGNCVSDSNHESYIDIPDSGLLVREDELEMFRKYGDGYRTTKLVGEILV